MIILRCASQNLMSAPRLQCLPDPPCRAAGVRRSECAPCRGSWAVLPSRGCFFFLESCSFVRTDAGVSLIFVGYFFHVGLGSRQVLEPWLFFFFWHTKNIWSMCVTIPLTICLIWDAWSLVWVLPVLVLAEELEKSWPFCILLEKVEVRNFFLATLCEADWNHQKVF